MNLRKLAVDGYHKLLRIHDTPHAIAGGLAIGILIGFTPLLGLKTLLGMAVAWVFRCSKIAAVVGVTLHDILWLIWPVVLRLQYKWGFWILHGELPPKLATKHFHIDDWLHWKTFGILWPMFVGSIVMALPLAVVSYFIALKLVTKYQSKLVKLIPHP